MARRFSIAVLGGTFDRLHRGHRALLKKAFEVADQVGVGVTTASYLRRFPKPESSKIRSYRARRAELRRYLEGTFRGRNYWIAALDDPFGRSMEPDVDALIISSGTRSGGKAVNRLRHARGLHPVKIVEVPLTPGRDGFAISSRRIRAGIIDREGRRRVPLLISIYPDSFRELLDLRRVRRAFPGIRWIQEKFEGGEPGSPEGFRVRISRSRRGPAFSAVASRTGAEVPGRASFRGVGRDPTAATISTIRQLLP